MFIPAGRLQGRCVIYIYNSAVYLITSRNTFAWFSLHLVQRLSNKIKKNRATRTRFVA
ncbi:hypothetical protein BDV24DRAFT_132869 [Aspergillus arachidicola]|uniref:Uncharacterized protein n=1 Tax=Aspergillus arachidicola TaxID=656916 RepID=A0A5N6Y6H1_9EURO|nr:hypothetical protein BDV24DRAFT_132869 [Aspergillus arachidicola]